MLQPVQILYHGTSFDYSEQIEEQGLRKMSSEAVYLTADIQVAYNYAKSKGTKTVICIIDAPQMAKDGFVFKHNDTYAEWTTEYVPPKYLVQLLVEDDSELYLVDQYAKEAVQNS